MKIRQVVIAAAVIGVVIPNFGVSARSLKPKHHIHVAAPVPSKDGVELGILAPPTRLTTLEQTYGDAAIARAQVQRRFRAEDAETVDAAAPYPCDPRVARADGYVCRNQPGVIGYGQTYAFTPSYVSSPLNIGRRPDEQTSILPPVTALFYAFDGLRFDPHN